MVAVSCQLSAISRQMTVEISGAFLMSENSISDAALHYEIMTYFVKHGYALLAVEETPLSELKH